MIVNRLDTLEEKINLLTSGMGLAVGPGFKAFVEEAGNVLGTFCEHPQPDVVHAARQGSNGSLNQIRHARFASERQPEQEMSPGKEQYVRRGCDETLARCLVFDMARDDALHGAACPADCGVWEPVPEPWLCSRSAADFSGSDCLDSTGINLPSPCFTSVDRALVEMRATEINCSAMSWSWRRLVRAAWTHQKFMNIVYVKILQMHGDIADKRDDSWTAIEECSCHSN